MKKQNIIDAIQDFFESDSSGDLRGKYHPEIIKVNLSAVFNQIIYNTWLNGKKFSDYSQLDAWSRTHQIDLSGQSQGSAYALLPFAPVQLPNNMGIRQVCDHDETGNVFAPIEATSNVVFSELEVDDFDDTPTYRLEQNNLATGAGEASHMLKVERLPLDGSITSLDVLMIEPIEQLDDFDEVVMPSGMEDNIIRQVIDFMSKKPRPDTANDNVIEQ